MVKGNNTIRGFTLVEVLLALAILGVGLVSILSLFVVGTGSVRHTVAMTEVAFVAQMTFSYSNYIGYDDAANISGSGVPDPDAPATIHYSAYTRIMNVTPVPNVTNLSKLDLNVSGNGVNESFTTYIAK